MGEMEVVDSHGVINNKRYRAIPQYLWHNIEKVK